MRDQITAEEITGDDSQVVPSGPITQKVEKTYVPDNTAAMSDAQINDEVARLLSEDGGSTSQWQAAGKDIRKKELEGIKAQLQKEHADFVRKETPIVGEGALGVVSGIGTGFREIARKMYNGIVTVADVVENTAAKAGIGDGSLITDKALNPSILVAPKDVSDIKNEEISSTITQVVAPMLLGGATASAVKSVGGGIIAAGAADATFDFLLSSREDGNISNLLDSTWVREVPGAIDVLGALKVDPDDSELSARLKGVVEGGILGVTIGAVVKGVKKLKGGKEVAETAADAAKSERAAKNADATVTTAKVSSKEWRKQAARATDEAVNSVTLPKQEPIPVGGGDLPTTVDPNIPSGDAPAGAVKAPVSPAPPKDPELLPLEQWAKEAQAVKPLPEEAKEVAHIVENITPKPGSLSNEELLERMYIAAESVSDKQRLRTPLTDAQLAEVAKVKAADPAVIDRIGTWHEGKGPLTDSETLVLADFLQSADKRLVEETTNFAKNASDPAAQVGFMRSMLGYLRVNEIRQGSASAKGATLRMEEVISRMMGMRTEEGLKILGARGRAALLDRLVKEYGGSDNLENMIKAADFVNKADAIMKRTNYSFAYSPRGIKDMHPLRAARDFVVKAAFNNMVSGVGTLWKANIGSGFITFKQALDTNLMAFTPGTSSSISEGAAYNAGLVSSMWDSLKMAKDSFFSPEKFTNEFKFDLDVGISGSLSAEERARRAAFSWAGVAGMVDTAVGVPTRMLVSSDVFWSNLNRQAVLRKEAFKAAVDPRNAEAVLKAGGEEKFLQGFISNPPRYAQDLAEDFASTAALRKDLQGASAKIAEGLTAAGDVITFRSGFGKVVFPFLRASFNGIQYAVDNSPLAVLSPQFYQAMKSANPQVRQMAVTKVISGSMLMAPVMMAASNNQLFGGYAENKELTGMVGAPTGGGPSIKVGDKWVSVAGIPLVSDMVTVAHTLSKMSGYVSEEEYQAAAYSAVGAITSVISPDQTFEAVSSLIKLMSSPNPDAAERFGAELTKRFMPYGGLLNSARNEVDPYKRYSFGDSFYDTVKARYGNSIPWMSEQYAYARDGFGFKIKNVDGVGPNDIGLLFPDNEEKTAVMFNLRKIQDMQELMQDRDDGYEFSFEKPGTSVTLPGGTKFDLTAHEYSNYLLARGGINPESGQPYSGSTTAFVEMQNIFSKFGFNEKDPRQMDQRDYKRMLSELRIVESKMNTWGRMYLSSSAVRDRVEADKEEALKKLQVTTQGGMNVIGE